MKFSHIILLLVLVLAISISESKKVSKKRSCNDECDRWCKENQDKAGQNFVAGQKDGEKINGNVTCVCQKAGQIGYEKKRPGAPFNHNC